MRYEDRVRQDRVRRETLRARCDHPHWRRGREAEEEEIKTPRAGIRPHPLSEIECEFLERERPRVVFIGTGQHGALPLIEGARQILAGLPTVIGPTPEIIREMEQERRPFAAILHVTC